VGEVFEDINCIYAFSFEKFYVQDPSKFLIKNEERDRDKTTETWNRENYVIESRYHFSANYYTVLQIKKKSFVLGAIPIDLGSWWPIKQSLIRRFFVSCQEGIVWSFEVSAFSYFVIII